MTLEEIALALGVLGFACFAWPIIRRVSGNVAPDDRPGISGGGISGGLRSPLWWTGFLLTVAAIALQRMASQQVGGG